MATPPQGAAKAAGKKSPKQPARLFETTGFFAFRTPLLPLSELAGWADGVEAPRAAPEELEAALARDRDLLRQRLRAITARPEVREALFVASPSLDESFDQWLTAPDGERGQKVERTLVRYFARMSGRSTPFGLFAGCSVGGIGEHTRILVGPRAGYQRHTRLDMDYVSQLSEALAKNAELRRTLPYRPNSSLYDAAARLRYAEARMDGRMRSYHLVAVDPTDYLSATLDRAKNGARASELAQALVDADPEIALEEAEGFIQELIDNQVLVAELEPTVTGAEPIHGLIETLGHHTQVPGIAEFKHRLEDVRDRIAALDAGGLGAEASVYRKIATDLEALPAPVELPRLFQVDMVKPAPDAMLGQAVVAELEKAVHLFRRLAGRNDAENLRNFREEFNKRYESQEVPLVEALDEESGIGFERSNAPSAEASPLLEGIAFGGPPGGAEGGPPLTGRSTYLLHKLQAALARGDREVVLDDEDLKRLEREPQGALADSFSVMCTVLAASPEALAAGDFQVQVGGAPGPSGAILLGRFCHGDPQLHERVVQHLRAEEKHRPDVVFAEIVHLPEGRVGNVLHRPVLREYEIVYLGRSGAPLERQIPITDLMVTVEMGRIVLRSKKLGKEVVPRLTNAHNFSHARNLSVYRFLCNVQREGVSSIGFGWGPLDAAPRLPRLRYGRIILGTAKWKIPGARLEPLGKAKGAARFAEVQKLRRELELPRFVAVADGDNELPVDLDNTLSVETFVQLIKERPELSLEELLGSDGCCAVGPEGTFCHEIVVPFVRTLPDEATETAERAERAKLSAPPVAVAPAFRSFAPGSEWLYAKLYTGAATADQILRDVVVPVVQTAKEAGAIDRWFFIRYSDPDWHIRLRFHGEPGALHRVVSWELQKRALPLLDDRRMWRMQLDTYEREIERYGGEQGILLAEKLFSADSDAVLAIVETLSGDEGADARWRLALKGIDLLLTDLGFDLAGRHGVMKSARQGFGREFGGGVGLDKQLGDKYRKQRIDLEAILAAGDDDQSWLAPGYETLRKRSAPNIAIAAELKAAESAGQLTSKLEHLAGSYVHMHANRILRSAQRAQELVLYDFLDRLYEGQAARAKQAAKKK